MRYCQGFAAHETRLWPFALALPRHQLPGPIPLALSFCEKAPEVWLIQLKYAERCAALALLAKLANTGNAVKGTDRLTGDGTFIAKALVFSLGWPCLASYSIPHPADLSAVCVHLETTVE